RRRHTIFSRDWSSDVCSSDLPAPGSPTKSKCSRDAVVQVEFSTTKSKCPEGCRKLRCCLDHQRQAVHISRRFATSSSWWKAMPRSEERQVGEECSEWWETAEG